MQSTMAMSFLHKVKEEEGPSFVSRKLTTAPSVSLLGTSLDSISSSSDNGSEDECSSSNSASDSESESSSDSEEEQPAYNLSEARTSKHRQPASAPAHLPSDGQKRLWMPRQRFSETQEESDADEENIPTLGLGLGMGLESNINTECSSISSSSSQKNLGRPQSASPRRPRFSGAHQRVASLSLTEDGSQVSVADKDQASNGPHSSPYTAHATITRSGPRSASDSLRTLVALNAVQPSSDCSANNRDSIVIVEQDSLPRSDDDLDDAQTDQNKSASQRPGLAAEAVSRRSAASRNLFATLKRNSAMCEDGENQPPSSLAVPVQGLSARRNSTNRPPSLQQLQLRMSSNANGASHSPKRWPSALQSPETSARWTDGSAPPRSSRTISSGGHRSASCPIANHVGPWYQFGGVTVTVTPPTPRPQPKSPIMGYVLTNAGRPCHKINYQRSADDIALLTPPCFEIAPGKQMIIEEKAREALEALKAMSEAEQQRRRMGFGGEMADGSQQAGQFGQGGSCVSSDLYGQQQAQQLIGLGWPALTSNNVPRQPSVEGVSRNRIGRGPYPKVSGRRVSGRQVPSAGKYVAPALRQRGRPDRSFSGSVKAPPSSAPPAPGALPVGPMDSTNQGVDQPFLCPTDISAAIANPEPATTPRSDGSGRCAPSRHEKWRSVENMRFSSPIEEESSNNEQTLRRAAGQRMLSRLGERGRRA
ncbi:unnamed protein product [Sympodiomycopsis kandeliae]